MKYQVKHKTIYKYDQPTTLSYNEAWMFPRELPFQRVLNRSVETDPQALDLSYRKDFFGNETAYFSIHESHKVFSIEISSEIERHVPTNILPGNVSNITWENALQRISQFDSSLIGGLDFIFPSPVISSSDDLKVYAGKSFQENRSLFDAVSELNTRIYEDFEYNQEYTTVATPLAQIIKARKGVCQDFAHFAVGCLRSMGLPARYVSGYIETYAPDHSPQLIGTAASHAWFAVYIPDTGWVDFDPTNNQLAKNQHITVAWGRDYTDVPPLKGVIFNSAKHDLEVSVEVKRME